MWHPSGYICTRLWHKQSLKEFDIHRGIFPSICRIAGVKGLWHLRGNIHTFRLSTCIDMGISRYRRVGVSPLYYTPLQNGCRYQHFVCIVEAWTQAKLLKSFPKWPKAGAHSRLAMVSSLFCVKEIFREQTKKVSYCPRVCTMVPRAHGQRM